MSENATPAGIVMNTATGRRHPIYFRRSPGPSEGAADPGAVQRHRSGGHHTEGFATEEEAVAEIASLGWKDLGMRWKRDGNGIPAIVAYA